jgi:tripartite ATP-independent transporter DctM subunit
VSVLSPEAITVLMFGLLLFGIFLGYQIAFLLAGIGLFFGLGLFGISFLGSFTLNFLSVMKNYILLAIPLFVLMGSIMERSGASERLFGSIYILSGRLPGGLAIATTLLATIFAACTGVVGASVVTMGVLSLPAMLKRGYDKRLASGLICAAGCLGVLIPPSIMIVIYGPVAGIPVGKLFMAAIGPGLCLSGVYILYILIRCLLDPHLGPPMSKEELRAIPRREKVRIVFSSLLPPIVIILAVLGSIFFGVAAPTEAAATGAFAAGGLSIFYKRFNVSMLGEAAESTLKTTSMILTMTAGAVFFVSTFMSIGGGEVVERVILGLPLGKWGIFFLMLLVVFILGMFLDWVAIVLLVVPLYTPIAAKLGFDAIWFATMIILNLQLSYITPPFALAAFYYRGIAPQEITMKDIYFSLLPFIALQIAVFVLCTLWPAIILWLPSQMGG